MSEGKLTLPELRHSILETEGDRVGIDKKDLLKLIDQVELATAFLKELRDTQLAHIFDPSKVKNILSKF